MKKKTFARYWAKLVTQCSISFIIFGLFIAMWLRYGGKFITISSDYRYFFVEKIRKGWHLKNYKMFTVKLTQPFL